MQEIAEGTVLEVAAQYITVNQNEEFDIGANPSTEDGEAEGGAADSEAARVINVVHSFGLNETSYDKKSFMAYIKEYMKRVKDHLTKTNPDRVEAFTKGIQGFVKQVLGDFDQYCFYVGESYDPEASVVLMKFLDETKPVLYYFKDGLKAEKV